MSNVPIPPEEPTPPPPPTPSTGGRSWKVPLVMGALVAGVLASGGFLFNRAGAAVNKVALESLPKGVTVIEARATTFRPSRKYVATVEPWLRAQVGPQHVSAYVAEVLVRPGAEVRRGQVLALLDCRSTAALKAAVEKQVDAVDARQKGLSREVERLNGMVAGGFVPLNDVDNKTAERTSVEAQLLATRAQLLNTSLAVDDCVLRAPFDGEVATRSMDPGGFARPGSSIVSLVDRRVVRIVADVPESDFDVVAPGTPVRIHTLATAHELTGVVARRAPAADGATRTVHFEIDLAGTHHSLPVGTTAELHVDVGQPSPATAVPLAAASVRGPKARMFVVDHNVASELVALVLGESDGNLFVDPSLKEGTLVVTEGRSLLNNGDKVNAKVDRPPVTPEKATVAPAVPAAGGQQ